MKCGICGATEYTPKGATKPIPLRDAHYLTRHKRQDHTDAYLESKRNSRVNREATREAKKDADKAVREALVKASRTVMVYGHLRLTADLTEWDFSGERDIARYPEDAAYQRYQLLQAQIKELQAVCDRLLREAYEHGYPVPKADWEAVMAASTEEVEKV